MSRVFCKSRWKFSLTSRPSVVSKQVKQKVARKNRQISKPTFGWFKVWSHWLKRGRGLTCSELGRQLSGNLDKANRKLAAQRQAATQPEPCKPNPPNRMPTSGIVKQLR